MGTTRFLLAMEGPAKHGTAMDAKLSGVLVEREIMQVGIQARRTSGAATLGVTSMNPAPLPKNPGLVLATTSAMRLATTVARPTSSWRTRATIALAFGACPADAASPQAAAAVAAPGVLLAGGHLMLLQPRVGGGARTQRLGLRAAVASSPHPGAGYAVAAVQRR